MLAAPREHILSQFVLKYEIICASLNFFVVPAAVVQQVCFGFKKNQKHRRETLSQARVPYMNSFIVAGCNPRCLAACHHIT